MIHVLNASVLQRSAEREVIEERKMLNIFAKPDSARMRTNRHAELGRHQQHCQYLVYAPKTTAIDLAKANRVGLQQLFEYHAILTVFAGCYPDGCNRAGNLRMAQHVIGRGRLFNPVRIERSEERRVG